MCIMSRASDYFGWHSLGVLPKTSPPRPSPLRARLPNFSSLHPCCTALPHCYTPPPPPLPIPHRTDASHYTRAHAASTYHACMLDLGVSYWGIVKYFKLVLAICITAWYSYYIKYRVLHKQPRKILQKSTCKVHHNMV